MRHLYDLTLAEFIDIYCGDYTSLRCAGEQEAKRTATAIIFEYQKAVAPAMYQSGLNSAKRDNDLRAKGIIFQMCSNLIALRGYDDVRAVYDQLRLSHRTLSDEALAKDVANRLRAVNFDLKRRSETMPKEEPPRPPEERRSAFLSDIAAVMTYFKFQIDVKSINAQIYADMRRQMEEQLKAKLRQMGRKKQ